MIIKNMIYLLIGKGLSKSNCSYFIIIICTMHNDIQFILYNLPEEEGKVQVIIRDETLWCTQKAMAQLFGVDRTVISKHLKNIFESSELQQD